MRVNTAVGILLRALCAIQMRAVKLLTALRYLVISLLQFNSYVVIVIRKI
ncbi:hypothetical protein T12_15604 [Trichinella patagoniensis]|uniref:Uncharacterized protein n=1 Tax=Trichinella patagoniensis TaxID=990121 RepID=A0A0V0YXW6_9BILA|nr:hypothetical protein T12_15604 [Trichinella patagoniensis]